MSSNNNTGRYVAWILFLTLSILPGTLLAQTQTQIRALQIGILPISTTRILIKNYHPLQVYLEHELNRPVELVTAPNFKTFHFNTIEGKYDVVITASHLGRLAQIEANFVPLVKYKALQRTLLLVAKDQPLKSVQDLRGKIIAGVDPIALAVNETKLWMRKQGMRAGIDYTMLETPSPISAAYSVHNHQSVLAISSSQGLKLLPEELAQSLEIFASLPELPGLLWLAHPRMVPEVSRLKAALLGFTSASSEGAAFYETTGYMGMREVTHEETSAMDPLAQEVKTLLNRNR